MSEVSVRIKVPPGYEKEVKKFAGEIEAEDLLMKSFRHCVEVELKKKLLKEIASRSRLRPKDALELGEAVKESWAGKHAV